MNEFEIAKLSEDFVEKIINKVKKDNFKDDKDYADELARQTYLFVAKRKFDIVLTINILFTFYRFLQTTVDFFLYESIITLIIFQKTKDTNLSSMLIQLFQNEYKIVHLEKNNEFLRKQLKVYGKLD